MSEDALLAAAAVDRVLERMEGARSAHGGDAEWPGALWTAMVDIGVPTLMVAEDSGGHGGNWQTGAAVIAIAAARAAPIPLAETMLANAWAFDPDSASGVATIAIGLESLPLLVSDASGEYLQGSIERVPWGRNAARLVTVAQAGDECRLVMLDARKLSWTHGDNLAGEPRDAAVLDGERAMRSVAVDADRARASAALVRSIQLDAAMRAALDVAVAYAGERMQFGKRIGQFQAVQQQLAVAAGEAAAAEAAVSAAIAAANGPFFVWRAAIAKARTSEAAGIVAAVAHQVLGALGFTREYHLQRLTRRLWSWRDECGGEAWWHSIIGESVLAQDPAGLWPMLLEETPPWRGGH